jgi:hypothetical protein
VTSGELSIILERVLNCYSVVFFEGRVAKVLLRVESTLTGIFSWGCRRGGFEKACRRFLLQLSLARVVLEWLSVSSGRFGAVAVEDLRPPAISGGVGLSAWRLWSCRRFLGKLRLSADSGETAGDFCRSWRGCRRFLEERGLPAEVKVAAGSGVSSSEREILAGWVAD